MTQSTNIKKVELLVTLDGYIAVAQELQGKSFKFKFDKHEGMLCLPRLHKNYNTHPHGLNVPLSSPMEISSISPSSTKLRLKVLKSDGTINWGLTGDNPKIKCLNVKAFGVILQKIDGNDIYTIEEKDQNEIRNKLLEWLQSFISWTGILTGLSPSNSELLNLEEDHIYFAASTENTFDFNNIHIRIKPRIPTKTIDENLLNKILGFSCQLKMPHLVHSLLRDARNALRLSDFRKCLVDVGTAVELALEFEIRKRLVEKNNESYADKKLEKATLGIKLEMLFSDKAPKELIQEKIKSDIVDKRNDVLHRGFNYSTIECKTAIELADKIIKVLNIPLTYESK